MKSPSTSGLLPNLLSALRIGLTALACAAAGTSAQTAAPASPAPQAPPMPATVGAPGALPTRSVSASSLGGANPAWAEQALERLHQQLQLRADQEPAWQRYVRELDAATGMMMRERPVAAVADEGAAQQLGRVAMQLQNRLAAIEAIEKAARELQVVLDPDQQKVANLGLLATLPPLLSATPVAVMAGPREDYRGRGDGALRQRRGGLGGGMGGGAMGGGMRP